MNSFSTDRNIFSKSNDFSFDVTENETKDEVSSSNFWQFQNEIPQARGKESYIRPEEFRAFTLDRDNFSSFLNNGSSDIADTGFKAPQEISIPTPDGEFARFQIEEVSLLSPELAAKFPDIKTYRGQGIDDPTATLSFDLTSAGFHGQVLSASGSYYIDPYWHLDDSVYISYFSEDLSDRPEFTFFDPEHDHDHDEEGITIDISNLEEIPQARAEETSIPTPETPDTTSARSGTQLYTYDLAVAATGEYTQFHGGTVAGAMSAITTAINRVSGLYETEFAISFQLVDNNDRLIYTDAATDPYSNNNASALLGENQTNIDSIIGDANYDIGHVFTTGGGGLAGLGVVGRSGRKAQGETGLANPIGDPFYVDYVAHEIGHQFGANHTFNGVNGSCGGNLGGGTAYEPGSGSTIMGYAGICGSDNLQNRSDDYFHSASFDEVRALIESGDANAAATITPTGNNVPTVDGGADYIIPAQTAFTLTATGSDPDGDTLTYNWEQRDLGPAQAVNAPDNGESPLFRSFSPTTDPTRTFPQISDILGNSTTKGEQLPTTNRELNFRVTARDNNAGGGGVNTDDVTLTVVDTGSPFQVTSNYNSANLNGGTARSIIWDVAGTNSGSINASLVNILLSNDGGNTFDTILESNTPNDGSELIVLPNDINTSSARLKVEAANNIFFDISDNNFSITSQASPAPGIFISDTGVTEGDSGTTTAEFTVELVGVSSGTYTIDYSTVDNTADSQDYNATNGTLSFDVGAGETSKTISVDVLGDTNAENDENFFVNLSNPSGGLSLLESQAIGTILNDDEVIAGTKWHDLDEDGVKDNGEPGLSGWTIFIDNNGNGLLDAGETSTVTDSDGNYSLSVDPGTYRVSEVLPTGWKQTFPNDLDGNETYQIDDGSEDTRFSYGEFDTMMLNSFDIASGSETLTNITVSWSSGATNGKSATLFIYNDPDNDGNPDDAVKLTEVTTQVANEGTNSFVTVPITPTTVSGTFFVAALYSVESGEFLGADTNSSAGKSWVAINDPNSFNTENISSNNGPFTVSETGIDGNWLLRAHAGAIPQTVRVDELDAITNVDFGNTNTLPLVTLSLENSPLAEDGGIATVIATLDAATTEDVTVNLAYDGTATNSTDYNAATSITITAGQTTGSSDLTGIDDSLVEGDETVIIDIDSVTNALENGTQQVTATISDDDVALPSVNLSLENSPLAEDGGVATVTATLDAATTEDVTVNLAYSGTAIDGTDYTSSTPIIISAGQTTGSIDLTGIDDSLVEGDETVIVDVNSVTNALENGTQQVTATISDDESNGTSGNDNLNGDNGDNTLNGEGGNDRLYGNGGNDEIDGGAGNDFIRGGDDNDTVTGGDGRDIIYGNENEDILVGGLDRDILVGGNGNDTLSGGTFNPATNISGGADNVRDRLRGDGGRDVFVLHADNTNDLIYDFENDIDKLGLSGGLSSSNLNISDNGSSTTIALSGGDTLATLLGVSDSTQITTDDFITL